MSRFIRRAYYLLERERVWAVKKKADIWLGGNKLLEIKYNISATNSSLIILKYNTDDGWNRDFEVFSKIVELNNVTQRE